MSKLAFPRSARYVGRCVSTLATTRLMSNACLVVGEDSALVTI